MANEKKSIIKDAITDYKEIQEAAERIAKDKLSTEFPDKFKNLVKEELDNNKKKSAKESYKKLDESDDKNTESIMKEKKETKKKVNEERNQDFMGDIESDTPNMEKEQNGDGVAFDKKASKDSVANKTDVKGGSKGKSLSIEKESKEGVENVNEEFDVSDLDLPDVEDSLDSAGPDDEIITMDEIEREISEMEQLKGELEEEVNDPFTDKVSKMKDQLQEMLNSIDQMQEQKKHGGKQNYEGRAKGGPTQQMIDEEEEEVDEQKKHGGKQNYEGRAKGGPTQQMIDEDDMISDEDIEAVVGDEEIDEAMGMAHSSSKHVAGDHLPGKDFAKHRHKRVGSVNNSQNESVKKKLNSLMEDNKKLTKKINESKKYKETVSKLVENYKTALDKYRTQLKEMAVYNTNLAHVNNLLVNEELALTQDEKIKIIKEFKSIESITDSQKKYKNVLREMKEGKKTISEGAAEKITGSVLGESSKKQLDEVSEKTAYENDKHIQRMKNLIEYTERKDNKNNLNS